MTWIVCRAGYRYCRSLYGNFDVRIHFLAQFSERAFNLYHIVVTNCNGNACGQVYR